MPRAPALYHCFLATFTLSTLALGGCKGSSSAALSSDEFSQRGGASSFRVSMTAMSEADFAHRHQFYYFATARIYRDCDEARWLWSEDGGVTWTSGISLPAKFDPGDEVPFVVYLTANDPSREHQMVAAAFPTNAGAPETATAQGSDKIEN